MSLDPDKDRPFQTVCESHQQTTLHGTQSVFKNNTNKIPPATTITNGKLVISLFAIDSIASLVEFRCNVRQSLDLRKNVFSDRIDSLNEILVTLVTNERSDNH